MRASVFTLAWVYLTSVQYVAAKQVFAHYMVGTMTDSEAVQDVNDAKAAGFDAFALNVPSTDSWATSAIQSLFNAARSDGGFKLFFSFDMTHFTNPSQFLSLIEQYANDSAYFQQNGRPFLSTFNGGTMTFGQSTPNDGWNTALLQPLQAQGITPFFVPDFDDWSGYPNGFFNAFPILDGAFSWETAWPTVSEGKVNVSDAVDQTMLDEAHAAGKVYMMPLSTFQFKYLPSQQWYRIGELNLAQRITQILQLQPDLVEVLTWNDAGESHYVGNFFADQIAGSAIGSYANGFDHKGWLQVLTPFIHAYKAGVTDPAGVTVSAGAGSGNPVMGAMWYRTLMTSASCSSSIQGAQNAQDAINFAIVLPSSGGGSTAPSSSASASASASATLSPSAGPRNSIRSLRDWSRNRNSRANTTPSGRSTSSYTINVYSNGNQIGSFPGHPGLNAQMVLGLQPGAASGQKVEVVDNASGTVVARAVGTKDVTAESVDANGVCNYNYEVVGF